MEVNTLNPWALCRQCLRAGCTVILLIFSASCPKSEKSCHHTISTPVRYPIASLTMPACFTWPFARTRWQYQQVQWEYILSSSPFPDLGAAPLTGTVAAVLVSFCTGDQTVRNILSISLSMVTIYSFVLFSLSKESLFSGSHRLYHSGQIWIQGRLCSPYASHASILGFPGGSDGKESACNSGDWAQSLAWEDPLEEGMTTHSRILAWRIPMGRGAWQATVYGVTKSRTWLST